MANRSKNATWASVKAELQQMDPKAIVNLVRDIYRSSQENRRFLHARLLGSKTELAKYRKLVVPTPNKRVRRKCKHTAHTESEVTIDTDRETDRPLARFPGQKD